MAPHKTLAKTAELERALRDSIALAVDSLTEANTQLFLMALCENVNHRLDRCDDYLQNRIKNGPSETSTQEAYRFPFPDRLPQTANIRFMDPLPASSEAMPDTLTVVNTFLPTILKHEEILDAWYAKPPDEQVPEVQSLLLSLQERQRDERALLLRLADHLKNVRVFPIITEEP
ncbi:MAG: hypothetical protein A2293_02820 [Elusimicrobia bacterium RIFOXYB2_FULL_49_7]|nr:MAG: hypothetical protein A2293_02820 [Elusimicrobia bacterium RIFOXYB2_FULL_49_7]